MITNIPSHQGIVTMTAVLASAVFAVVLVNVIFRNQGRRAANMVNAVTCLILLVAISFVLLIVNGNLGS